MLSPFLIIFSLMLAGSIAMKYGWLNTVSCKGLADILLNIAIPAMLLNSMILLDIGKSLIYEFIIMILLASVGVFLFALITFVYSRIRKMPLEESSMIIVTLLLTNNGFMGFPISLAFFGETGLLFTIANNLVMNVTMFTYCIYLLNKSRLNGMAEKEPIKQRAATVLKRITNPTMLALVIGLLIGISGLGKFIPEAVMDLLSTAGSLATPLSMLYIGATLYGNHFLKLLHNPLVLETSVVKVFILPLLMIGLVYFLPASALMKQILVLNVAFPTAAMVPVIVEEYGKGTEKSTQIVLVSTLLSLISIPVFIWFITLIW